MSVTIINHTDEKTDERDEVTVAHPPRDEWYRSGFEPELADFPEHPAQDYDAVFMEPLVFHQSEIGSKCSAMTGVLFGTVFRYTQTGGYYLFVFLLGLILSFVWGLVFAVVNFVIIWLAQPVIKLCFIFLRIVSSLVRATVRSLADPLFESWGQMFSFVRGKFKLNVRTSKHNSSGLEFV